MRPSSVMYVVDKDKPNIMKKRPTVAPKYGSFYLRLGAIGKNIGNCKYFATVIY